MRDEPLQCPEGSQEGCRQNKGMGGEGVAASSVIGWGAASLLPPVWASEAFRASRPFRSTPGDNATPTGFPGVVRRVDRASLDPLGVWLQVGTSPGGCGAASLVASRVLALWGGSRPGVAGLVVEVGADSLSTASSWIIRDVDGTKVATYG